jgi:hypothetical protein
MFHKLKIKTMENKKIPAIPKMPLMPPSDGTPGISFQMTDKIKKLYREHHEKCHLDENGEWKEHLKEKGFEYMKRHMK